MSKEEKEKKDLYADMDVNINAYTWKTQKPIGTEFTLRIDSKVCKSSYVFEDIIKELKKYLRLRFKESIK